jgi:predicted negative regulator of RcsB-dependent stress response
MEAIDQFRKALNLGKDAVVCDHLGDAYLKTGDAEKAHNAWLEALKLAKEKELKSSIKSKLAELEKNRCKDKEYPEKKSVP